MNQWSENKKEHFTDIAPMEKGNAGFCVEIEKRLENNF